MKLSTFWAFIAALAVHLVILLLLIVNVSLEKPQRPQDQGVRIMHATVIGAPVKPSQPAKDAPVREERKQETTVDDSRQQEAEEALRKSIQAQKEAEEQRVLALKKQQEEEQRRLEEERQKQEAEKKRLEEERKKQEEEQKRREEEALKKAREEEEAKKREEQEKARALEEQRRRASEEALALEEQLLGGQAGAGAAGVADEYGARVQTLIEQNWRIDPSWNGKKVVVTLNVDNQGMISNEKCQGDAAVCAGALATLRLIGMLPRPPVDCRDCSTIVLTMTPQL